MNFGIINLDGFIPDLQTAMIVGIFFAAVIAIVGAAKGHIKGALAIAGVVVVGLAIAWLAKNPDALDGPAGEFWTAIFG